MNVELEGLVLALEAVTQARAGDEADRWDAVYRARLDDVLSRYRGVSREK